MKLSTLIRLTEAVESATRPTEEGGKRDMRQAARRLTETVRQDGRVQDAVSGLRDRAREVRGAAQARADAHLERLIEQRHGGQTGQVPDDVARALAARRAEREARAAALRARQALLSQAEGNVQRQILLAVADTTPWAGGQAAPLRYTTLLDRLAPSGAPGPEMAVHRALWTLAERRVLAVSPHGEISACALEAGVLLASRVAQLP